MGFFKRQAPIPLSDLVVEPEPTVEPVTEPHPLYGENYEPHFPRLSITRRVLGHITPEVDRDDLGPRNTIPALTAALIADDHTEISYPEHVRPHLEALIKAGLVTEHAGTYQVTDAGWRELMN